MATDHHLSIVTNSSIKSPVNPKTGFTFTLYERQKQSQMLSPTNSLDEKYFENSSVFGKPSSASENKIRTVKFSDAKFDDEHSNSNSSKILGDDFYQQLITLKNEHQKTLKLCEQVYNEQLSAREKINNIRDPGFSNTSAILSEKKLSTSQPINTQFNTMNYHPLFKESNVVEKPPRPENSESTPIFSKRNKSINFLNFQQNNEQENIGENDNRYTNDDEMSIKLAESLDLACKETSERKTQFHEMWDNFSVDNYVPITRNRSNSLPTSKAKDSNVKTEWKHRITIPKPFKMTQRESSNTKKKTSAMIALEKEKIEKKQQEESECQKKFKAQPLPAHIYMPLYEEILENQESRRRLIHDKNNEIIKSMQKPFKFLEREEERKKQRSKLSKSFTLEENKKPIKFKATPFPEKAFNNESERIKEEEEYRKIKIKMRALELLSSSSLPPNMAMRGEDYFYGKSRQKASGVKSKGSKHDGKFQPKINRDIPDFEKLHRNFAKNLNANKMSKEGTVCHPFEFHSRQAKCRQSSICTDSFNDSSIQSQKQQSNSKNSHQFSGSWSSSLDAMPTRMTSSSTLRTSTMRKKIEDELQQKLAAIEERKKQREKEKRLRHLVIEKAQANCGTKTLQETTKEKLKEYRENERTRMQEYRQQLKEIEKKVEERPLLFERTLQENARKKAERRYTETLSRAGLTDQFVSSKGSACSTGTFCTPVQDDGSEYSYTGSAQRSVQANLSRRRSPSPDRSLYSNQSPQQLQQSTHSHRSLESSTNFGDATFEQESPVYTEFEGSDLENNP